jgi:hypothetical protein
MSLFSLVLYLWHEQHDWQITRDNFGTYERQLYLSQPEKAAECAKVEITEIQSKLRQIGNVFADYKPTLTPSSFMCLPPRSSLLIKPNEISIRTPFCEIRFVVEQPWIMKSNGKPGTTVGDVFLPDGKQRFETRDGIIRATIGYERFRAQSREMPKYQNWANDVVDRARKWFDPTVPDGNSVFFSDFDDTSEAQRAIPLQSTSQE